MRRLLITLALGSALFAQEATVQTGPATEPFSPAGGIGYESKFTMTFNMPTGISSAVFVLHIGADPHSKSQGCEAAYDTATNSWSLLDDAGTVDTSKKSPSQAWNRQCALLQDGSTVSGWASHGPGERTVTVTWNMAFNPRRTGIHGVWVNRKAIGSIDETGWQKVGLWCVPDISAMATISMLHQRPSPPLETDPHMMGHPPPDLPPGFGQPAPPANTRMAQIKIFSPPRVVGQQAQPKAPPGTFEVLEKTIVFRAPNGETYALQRLPKQNPDGSYVSKKSPKLLPDGTFEVGEDGFDLSLEMKIQTTRVPKTFSTDDWLTLMHKVLWAHPQE